MVTALLAQLLALTFNINRRDDVEPLTAEDFLPGCFGPKPPPKPATAADAAAFLRELGD